MGRLVKFWSLPRREKQFFVEAGTLLLLSKLCVKTIAFRYIDSFLRGRWKNGNDLNRADDIKLITLSLSRAFRHLNLKVRVAALFTTTATRVCAECLVPRLDR